MNDQWMVYATALESGESDRVSEVIDDIRAMDLPDRIDLLDVCFDELTELYTAADDGYVRQSVVRVGERLVPGTHAVMAIYNDDRSIGLDTETVREQTDALCGFLLEAMTDENGRVRKAAIRGFKDVGRTYDALEDEETLSALARELERMAEDCSGEERTHLLEAKQEIAFTRQSPLDRVLEGINANVGDSERSEK